MKKKRFTESQILRVLKEVEGGRHVTLAQPEPAAFGGPH
ncbi:hypothetical protein P298_04790 [Salmonella enterica subsp. arizonae serovar 18:z4,z23:- str. CVM N26626]|uniref:Transposase n=2 Tax=Salmonella enterica subsp. arizonae TaxID=59203 RepID=A0A379SA92_SALER|nr:hypothetical protein P297_15465 [Salmonella enterica subsp. arizonae serovar 18:z4,z23:- str. CVM N26625]OLW05092.1 hypothetical protein P298_04790 [Salmonella enterica subsp. arizonae serovar 18:z4,z23:- str. CVM N26626]OLW16687.1 hypothetical protein P292_11210 [Salmonella enterica subsp. arizonae serovar 18:z4,z23:- str. CVM N18554]OLW22555.1 hypothetical protein P290_01020 [Salmonella enterica subsp. arizonae serovar 18:z4,z23:- str. CVM N18383]OLW28876.1 hypothetical protein P291_01340 